MDTETDFGLGNSSSGGGEEATHLSPELARELILSSLLAKGSGRSASSGKSSGKKKSKPLKMTNDAARAAAELLRLFVVEARNRAAIEAECEAEGSSKAMRSSSDVDGSGEGEHKVLIGAHHITKLAAELLLEFS